MVDSLCLHKFIVIYQEAIVPYNNKVLYDESCFWALDDCSLRTLRTQSSKSVRLFYHFQGFFLFLLFCS